MEADEVLVNVEMWERQLTSVNHSFSSSLQASCVGHESDKISPIPLQGTQDNQGTVQSQ